MKTLKTRFIEALVFYMTDHNLLMHINVYWDVSDKLNGYLPVIREENAVMLSIPPETKFVINHNFLEFEGIFVQDRTVVRIPTASIMSLYSDSLEIGMNFCVSYDYNQETGLLLEDAAVQRDENSTKKPPVKQKPKLTVVK